MPCSSSDSASTSGLPVGSSRSAGRFSASQRCAAAATRAADAQVLAILRDPVLHPGPVPEQRLVRDRDDGASVIGELGDEQPVLDEGIDELATLARRDVGPGRALAADRRLPVLPDAHQRVQDLRQLGFDVVGQFLEDGLGALRERTFDTAELAIRGEREHAVLGAALVQLLEGELQQRQDFPVPRSRIAQHVVEALAARRVFLEAQARGARRQADHLADLARRSAASGRTVRRLPSAQRASAGSASRG